MTTERSGAEETARASSLGADWTVGPDGVRSRRAARVILLDDAGRALLVRGHDADQPERSWWFTVGGGIDGDETAAEAAVREVREETGIVLEPAQLVGPVLTRVGIFDFFKETCRQDEVFYAAVVPHVDGPDRTGWTDDERELLDELAWLSADELRAQPLEYFPTALPDVLDQLARGWDGAVRHLGTEHDD